MTAIGSAAIVHQIARACADGAIRSCGCGVNNEYSEYDVSPNTQYSRATMLANEQFGLQIFGRIFGRILPDR